MSLGLGRTWFRNSQVSEIFFELSLSVTSGFFHSSLLDAIVANKGHDTKDDTEENQQTFKNSDLDRQMIVQIIINVSRFNPLGQSKNGQNPDQNNSIGQY